jgi:cycloeucalenol cycloisomerase
MHSRNPGKLAAERWYLIYTLIWVGVVGVVMMSGLAVAWSRSPWGDIAFMTLGVGVWLGLLVGGYIRRVPEDRERPWHRLYHTKFMVWMFIFAFLGNYYTEYFYEILHLQYGFETRWNLNHVPLFLYFLTVAYFTTYGTLLNFVRRAAAPYAWSWLAYLSACFAVAGLETALNANPFIGSLFCYDDLGFVLWFGTLMYGTWFVVTGWLWFPIDETEATETPLLHAILGALAGFMLVLLVNEIFRSGIAPLFTDVQIGAVGMDNFGTSCLQPKP